MDRVRRPCWFSAGWLLCSALSAACSADPQTAGTRAPGAPSSSGAGSGTSAGAGAVDGTAGSAPGAIPQSPRQPPPTAPKPSALPAGMFMPKPELDRDVQFDWEETVPGASACQPGTYEGTFACAFFPLGTMPDAGVEPFPVDGPISLTLEPSKDGEFLVIANGEFSALALGVFGMRAELMGTLDCHTLALDARAVNGAWAFGDPANSLLQGGTFDGDFDGTLDGQSLVLTGNWALTDPAFGTCDGPWSATYTP